jgi:hypothetical protein
MGSLCDPGCGTASTVEDVFGEAVIDRADGYRPSCRDRVVALLSPEAQDGWLRGYLMRTVVAPAAFVSLVVAARV